MQSVVGFGIILAVFFDFSCASPCLRRPPRNDTSEFSLIHVGKTGGTTLMAVLPKKFDIQSDFHLCQPSLEDVKDRPVMVTIREPIARTLSIWRWGKFKCSNRPACFGAPRELFECFPFLNDYLEARGNLSNNNRTGLSDSCLQFADSPEVPSLHWKFDHRWHLEKFDEDFLKEVFPVRQSNLVEDFVAFCLYFNFEREKCFNMQEKLSLTHTNTKYHTELKDYYLSSEAREFLESELKEEIEMYNHLANITNDKVQTVFQREKKRRDETERRKEIERERHKKTMKEKKKIEIKKKEEDKKRKMNEKKGKGKIEERRKEEEKNRNEEKEKLIKEEKNMEKKDEKRKEIEEEEKKRIEEKKMLFKEEEKRKKRIEEEKKKIKERIKKEEQERKEKEERDKEQEEESKKKE